jgi:hypothetical protein
MNMILYKNISAQTIYTRVINVSTGAGVTGLVLTAYISKDNGNFIAASEALGVVEKAYGVYSLVLSAAETNCDVGCVVFTGTNNTNQLAETVYFQTSAQYPTVGSVTGNIGTLASPVTMFATHSAQL